MTDSLQPNEALQSQLSAFIDNELPDAECELFTRRLVRDAELKRTMSNYLLIGEAMRIRSAQPSPDFSSRIAAALADDAVATEQAPAATAATAQRSMPRWLKPVGAIGVAASVAMLAVTLVRAPQVNSPGQAAELLAPVAVTAQRVNEPDSYVVPSEVEGPTVPLPAARLTNYVVAHSEYTSPLGHRTTLTGLLAADVDAAAAASSSSMSSAR